MVQIGFAALWAIAITLLSIAAAVKGRWPERTGATAAMISWLTSLFIVQHFQAWSGPQLALLAADTFLSVAFLLIGIYSERIWPLIACGFQCCSVGLDCAYLLQPLVWSAAYYVGIQITSWAVLIPMATGVFNAWQQRSSKDANSRLESDL